MTRQLLKQSAVRWRILLQWIIIFELTVFGVDVKITLDIEADIPDGVPDHVVRIVSENARTLKFENFGFEGE